MNTDLVLIFKKMYFNYLCTLLLMLISLFVYRIIHFDLKSNLVDSKLTADIIREPIMIMDFTYSTWIQIVIWNLHVTEP